MQRLEGVSIIGAMLIYVVQLRFAKGVHVLAAYETGVHRTCVCQMQDGRAMWSAYELVPQAGGSYSSTQD